MMSKFEGYIGKVVEDPEFPDELLLTFPPEMLEELGWHEGDNLIFDITESGVTLKKKDVILSEVS